MNKKLYIQLLLTVLVGNYAVASQSNVKPFAPGVISEANKNNFFNQVGRTYYVSGKEAIPTAEKISFADAKEIKRNLKDAAQQAAGLSKDKAAEAKMKVVTLKNFIKQNQVLKKSKIAKGRA